MNTAGKLLATTGAMGGCGGAYFVAKPLLSPDKQITTADFNKKGVWKAIFLTHKEDANFKSTFSLTGSEAVDTASVSIRDKCKQLVKDNSKDLIEEWCVVPTPKTIEARLYLDEKELASDDDDRQNLFVLYKEDEGFINAIKGGGSDFTKNSNKTDAKTKIETYCSGKMSVSAEDPSYSNIKNWCTKPPRDVKAKLVEDGIVLIGESDTAGWADKYEKLKGESAFLTAIGVSTGSAVDKASEGSKLKTWCTTEYAKKLHDDGVYPTNFELSKTRCSK
ncbi:hypothetical protein HF1_09520 [Mycoplasma haemofelis str. Langford 1]|uniref:Lipoprotein n=1 Tax=Mycoplasma haemofelis (strain Langford 1) TaxID=941640 RepID=E8ZII9_MYCHL|nr:hypothetical protein [Mycoplasma haemofelis]CBY92960.1 hypothetical protein HF1_09520 [Mycoplasma haemofelis str. Langford 1]